MESALPLHGAVERGRAGESIAALYLRLQGLTILDANRRQGSGEVDLIAREGPCLVFVEVRLRRVGARVDAATSVGPAKQRRVRDAASRLLQTREDLVWPGRRVRFDVVTLTLGPDGFDLAHLRNVRMTSKAR